MLVGHSWIDFRIDEMQTSVKSRYEASVERQDIYLHILNPVKLTYFIFVTITYEMFKPSKNPSPC